MWQMWLAIVCSIAMLFSMYCSLFKISPKFHAKKLFIFNCFALAINVGSFLISLWLS